MGRPALKLPVGTEYGRLTVISEPFRVEGYHGYCVRCQCKCNNEVVCRQTDLKCGVSTACDECYGKDRRKVVVDEEYGWWTVEEPVYDDHDRLKWLCRCRCGNVRVFAANDLLSEGNECCWECSSVKKRTGIGGTLWRNIRNNAKERNLALSIDWEFAEALLEAQDYRCALTGEPIHLPQCTSEYLKRVGTASLDRIDSSRGYEPDNVQWVHKNINILKMDWGEDEFVQMCCMVADYFRSSRQTSTSSQAPPQ